MLDKEEQQILIEGFQFLAFLLLMDEWFQLYSYFC